MTLVKESPSSGFGFSLVENRNRVNSYKLNLICIIYMKLTCTRVFELIFLP